MCVLNLFHRILEPLRNDTGSFPTNMLGDAFVVTKFVRVTMVQFTLSVASRHLSQWERQGACADLINCSINRNLDVGKMKGKVLAKRKQKCYNIVKYYSAEVLPWNRKRL